MKTLLVFLIAGLFCACNSAKNGKANTGEGLQGTVYWVTGNQMPSIDGPKTDPRKPVVREIYICAPIKMGDLQEKDGLYQNIAGKEVAVARSDEKGRFFVALKPGKYSVFVKEEKGFFANLFDGEGFVNVVEVEAGKVAEIEILVNYTAAY